LSLNYCNHNKDVAQVLFFRDRADYKAAPLKKKENKLDYLEKEIIHYLVIITQGETSRSEAREMTGMIGGGPLHWAHR